jgi:hypothetical protein
MLQQLASVRSVCWIVCNALCDELLELLALNLLETSRINALVGAKDARTAAVRMQAMQTAGNCHAIHSDSNTKPKPEA